ncbi:MAG TPA: Gfo/Idh/MocA family oxidoreductase [Thermoanaerobaculia bacterium]|nr:Gfo/Idh/MocA family oxidoreductase [Thermoanaerobaculia bacterium]
METKIRIGVVGTGYLGRLHARILTEMPEVETAGFVEVDDAIASEVGASLGLERFPDAASLASRVDCAVVATPTHSHFEIAELFLRAGRDVLVEKPITATPSEARALIELERKSGRIVQVGHVERYNPAITAIAPFLSGTRFVEATRLGVFVTRSLDIDVLHDLMIHDLNLVLSLLESEVVDVRAVGVPVLTDKVDIANVRLQLASGAVANLTASRVSNERVRKVRFFGADSYISVDTKEQDVKGYRLVAGNGAKAIQPLEVDVLRKEPLRAELEAFIECVRSRSRPLVGSQDGLAALELAGRVGEAIEESLTQWEGSR